MIQGITLPLNNPKSMYYLSPLQCHRARHDHTEDDMSSVGNCVRSCLARQRSQRFDGIGAPYCRASLILNHCRSNRACYCLCRWPSHYDSCVSMSDISVPRLQQPCSSASLGQVGNRKRRVSPSIQRMGQVRMLVSGCQARQAPFPRRHHGR